MRRSALALVAAVTALGFLSGPAAAWVFNDCDVYYPSCRGSVIPCSLDGVIQSTTRRFSAIPSWPGSCMDSSDRRTAPGTSSRGACAVCITAVKSRLIDTLALTVFTWLPRLDKTCRPRDIFAGRFGLTFGQGQILMRGVAPQMCVEQSAHC